MHAEDDVLLKIKTLLTENSKGLTTEDIAKSLPLNRTSTAKYLNTLLISGQVEQQVVGRAKLYKCCHRLPFAQMLMYQPDAIIVMDHERHIREINPQFIQTFGILQDQSTRKKI